MPHFIHPFAPRGLAVTFTGVLSQADREAFEQAARLRIAEAGAIDALIVLKDFQGLGADIDPHNLDFYAQHADDILRMAIPVGLAAQPSAEVSASASADSEKPALRSTKD